MSFYNFIRGIPNKLGTGTQDLGLVGPRLPLDPLLGAGVHVQRSFAPTAPGYMKTGQQLIPVSWLGNGNAGYDPMLLARLAEKG